MKPASCVVCKDGQYREIPIQDGTDLHNEGLGVSFIGRTGWRATECDKCGNVQMFRYQRSDAQMGL